MRVVVVLLRGINVAGKNRLPMDDLRTLLDRLGARGVRTYIQSGNAVLRIGASDLDRFARSIGHAIADRHGFNPAVLVLDVTELRAVFDANPFTVNDPSTLHVGFLWSSPAVPDIDRLERLRAPSERYALQERAFYLHAPDGIGRSRLAQGAEAALGVSMTVRNLRTVSKLREIASGLETS